MELGAGLSDFEPLQDEQELPLFPGSQGGAHFFLHAKISGMSPGMRGAPREANPSTWFSIHSESGEDITALPCDFPRAYEESDDGRYELPYGRAVQVAPSTLSWIYGERVRVQVEVRDAEGRYATDDRWVVAVAPPALPDAGVPDALPSPDGSLPDAGVPDGNAVPPDAEPDTGD